jgi:uncharacterized protein
VTVHYADTSALVSAYLVDEEGHEEMRVLLLEGADPVVTSALTHVELTSAVVSAGRAGRLPDPSGLLARFDEDCGEAGLVTLLASDPGRVLPLAQVLVRRRQVRTLDALHLAVASIELPELDAVTAFVTCDRRQAVAAVEEGLRVRTTERLRTDLGLQNGLP